MTTVPTKANPINYQRMLDEVENTANEMRALWEGFAESITELFKESVSQLPCRPSSPENSQRSLIPAVTPPSPALSETIRSTEAVAERAINTPSPASQVDAAIPDDESASPDPSLSSSPKNTPSSLTPEVPLPESTETPVASTLNEPAATLTLQQANPVHKTAKLTWGSYIYTVEQDLPATTTDEEWEHIVKAYEALLNKTSSTADCHAGIEKLSLSLDKAHGTVNIVVPDETPDPSHPERRNKTIQIESNTPEVKRIVAFLTSVLTKTESLEISRTPTEEPESADTAKTAPASELTESREIIPLSPPLKLRNPTKTLCYLNSLIQMIMASPHLQAQFMTSPQLVEHLISYSRPEKPNSYISSLDTTGLDAILFPATSKTPYKIQQRDILETLGALVYQLPTEEIGKFEISKRIIKAFDLTRKGSDFESFTKEHDLRASKREPDIFLQNSYESSLPLLSVTPNGTNRTLLETIQQQHCQQQNHVSGVRSTLTSDEPEGTQFTQRDEISKFLTAPQTLFIHADRTNPTDTRINRNRINLEETLLLPGSLFSQEGDTIHYELRSFTVHEGRDSRQGHYISYVRTPGKDNQSRYYKLDDLHPEAEAEITEEEFLSAAQNFTLAAFDLASSRENPSDEPRIPTPLTATVAPNDSPLTSPTLSWLSASSAETDGPSRFEELPD